MVRRRMLTEVLMTLEDEFTIDDVKSRYIWRYGHRTLPSSMEISHHLRKLGYAVEVNGKHSVYRRE